MKWVKVTDGKYKYVSDDDSRSPVSLPDKPLPTSFSTPFTPSWKKYEVDMWNTDRKYSTSATDKFIDERAHETKTDPRAKRWEEGRKAAWAKDKPEWIKKNTL